MKNEKKMRTISSVGLSGKARAGFTMVELLLVILVGGLLVLAGVQGYNKVYIPTQADAEVKKCSFVIGGIERYKNNYNNGAFPAKSGAIPSIPLLKSALGGTTGVNDVVSWTYTCAVGNNSPAVIVTEVYQNVDKRAMIIAGINNSLSPWVATATGLKITITRANSVCN